jgi:hypothetical protein
LHSIKKFLVFENSCGQDEDKRCDQCPTKAHRVVALQTRIIGILAHGMASFWWNLSWLRVAGGRIMNPTDAYRKQARKREIKRNKAERHYIREAFSRKTQLEELKSELEQLIALEQTAEGLNKLQKLRKKVVMEAYEVAIRRQKVGAILSALPTFFVFEQCQGAPTLLCASAITRLLFTFSVGSRKKSTARSRQRKKASSCMLGCQAYPSPSLHHCLQDPILGRLAYLDLQHHHPCRQDPAQQQQQQQQQEVLLQVRTAGGMLGANSVYMDFTSFTRCSETL